MFFIFVQNFRKFHGFLLFRPKQKVSVFRWNFCFGRNICRNSRFGLALCSILIFEHTLIRMYPNPLSPLPKCDLKSAKSLPVAVTPKRLLWSNLNTALKRKIEKFRLVFNGTILKNISQPLIFLNHSSVSWIPWSFGH